MNREKKRTSRMDIVLNNWLAIMLTVLGLFSITVGVVNQQRVTASTQWPSVSGIVTKSSIVTTRRPRRGRSNRARTKKLPEIQFNYQVDDKQLSNRQRYFADQSVAQVVKKYPVGSTVPVTYDPDKQSDSFIEPPTPSSVPAGMGILLLAVAAGMVLVARRDTPKPAKAPTTIGEISSLIGQDVRELKISGWTDQQVSKLIEKKLAESQSNSE